MKILYTCLSKSWGGLEMFTLETAKHLVNKNIAVEILCFNESRLNIEANASSLIVHTIKASSYFHPFEIIRLANLFYINKYDLIHSHASKDLWTVVPALKMLKSKIPLILTKHVGSFINKKDFLHKWLYNRIDKVLAISTVIKNNLLDTCPITEDKIVLHHNYVDTGKFNPEIHDPRSFKKEYNIKEEDILIGMMARMSKGKGHEEFLFAAKELSLKFSNLKFIIVGEASHGEDDYANYIKQMADEFNLSNLFFTGYRTDTPQILAALNIFVFPSHAEAFGIALIEAMAMGIATICSNSDGILDIAINGETSLMFEKKNKFDLIVKLETLIGSQELRKNLGINGRKRVLENFDCEHQIQKTIHLYSTMIK